jgi:tRNA(Ile)-lysidine synthase TilS/MesJ
MHNLPQYCENLKRKTATVLYKKSLLKENDNIIIGLSGGKDSLVLTDILARQKKHLPFKIKLTAVHVFIEEMGYKTNIDFLNSFCSRHNVDFKLIKTIIPKKKNNNKNDCFICSWTRRKKLFELTKNSEYNKIALGHNMDDAIETLFMNMFNHGSISSMPYNLEMFDGRISVIRPLLEFTNVQLQKYSDLCKFPKEIKTCTHGKNTIRQKSGEIINLLEGFNKDAKKNIFRSMNNQFPEYLPK